MSTGSAETPSLAEGRDLILTEEAELPQAQRPRDQSIAAVAAWLVDEARRLPSAARFVDEFAWRMLATGLPLLRVTLHCGTLHPQFLGATFAALADAPHRVVGVRDEIGHFVRDHDGPCPAGGCETCFLDACPISIEGSLTACLHRKTGCKIGLRRPKGGT
jgi:hypothetical protein